MKVRLHNKYDCDAVLIDIITPGVKVNENDAAKYYAGKPPQQAAKGTFKESQLVFQKADGSFVCIPDTAGNRWLWTKQ